ncbi:hypothetical protein GGX14DRAFT_403084 [Mycena pura]|uniref:Uncharacterized protein n=1 Tax=Mycena pura TaxID=153505 RepID=A0AAD6Y6K2_9AGAR|nr:hypothetical protein GGX14DRAFT_403084 [Mycena pura]
MQAGGARQTTGGVRRAMDLALCAKLCAVARGADLPDACGLRATGCECRGRALRAWRSDDSGGVREEKIPSRQHSPSYTNHILGPTIVPHEGREIDEIKQSKPSENPSPTGTATGVNFENNITTTQCKTSVDQPRDAVVAVPFFSPGRCRLKHGQFPPPCSHQERKNVPESGSEILHTGPVFRVGGNAQIIAEPLGLALYMNVVAVFNLTLSSSNTAVNCDSSQLGNGLINVGCVPITSDRLRVISLNGHGGVSIKPWSELVISRARPQARGPAEPGCGGPGLHQGSGPGLSFRKPGL